MNRSCLSFLCLVQAIFGMQAQDQPRDSIIDLDEVILRSDPPEISPVGLIPAEVISARAIRQQNPVDFAGTLNQVPGVYFMSGALNTNRITIRGVGARTAFGTDKLRMYYNDIPVTNGSGFSALEAFDLENLNSIGVVKGPKAAAYGAALGGALLLRSGQSEDPGTIVRNRTSFGSYGMFKSNLGYSHKDSTLKAGLRYDKLSTQGYRSNNAFDRDGLLLNLEFTSLGRHNLNALVSYIDYSAEIPSSLGATDFEEDPTQAAFTWAQAKGYEANRYTLTGLSDRVVLGENLSFTGSLFYAYLDHYEPRPFNILDEFTLGFGGRAVLRASFPVGSQLVRAEFGGELYRDEYTWSTYENLYPDNGGQGSLQGEQLSRNKEFRRQNYLFASVEWPVTEAFRVRGGLGYNHTLYDFRDLFGDGNTNGSARRDFDGLWLPSLDLRYSWGSSFAYLNISRGFNNPSLEESLSPDGLVNPEIGQEKGYNYEAGVHWVLPGNRMQVSAAVYRMDIRGLLVAERVGEDQYIGRNAGSTRHNGLELSWEYRLRFSGKVQFIPFLSYTLNSPKFRDFVDDDLDYSGNRLTGVPRNRVYGGLRLQGDSGWYWNGSYQFVDAIPLTDANALYSDAYSLVNMQGGYNFNLGGGLSLGLEAGLNNLLDARYASSVLINATGFGGSEPRYYYPGNGRNYYLGILLVKQF